jgi:transposase-like protein
MPKIDMTALQTEKENGTGPKPQAAVPDEIMDQLLAGYKKPEDLLGPSGLLKQLIGQLVTRAMGAEMNHHLGYKRGQAPPEDQNNRRNGNSSKTVRSESRPPDMRSRQMSGFTPGERRRRPGRGVRGRRG